MTTVDRGSAPPPTHTHWPDALKGHGKVSPQTYRVTPDVLHHILAFAFNTSGEMSQVLGRWEQVTP